MNEYNIFISQEKPHVNSDFSRRNGRTKNFQQALKSLLKYDIIYTHGGLPRPTRSAVAKREMVFLWNPKTGAASDVILTQNHAYPERGIVL